MVTGRIRASRLVGLFTLLAASILTGCMDYNKTVRNGTNQTLTTLELEIEIPGDVSAFPPVDEWYDNNQPTQKVNLGRNVFTGGTRFRLIFKVNVPPGKSVHVGWEFHNSGIKMVDQGTRLFSLRQTPHEAGALAVQTTTKSGRLVLEAFVAKNAPRAVRLDQFQWAANTAALKLADLLFGNQRFEALRWTDFPGKLPMELKPGDAPMRFEVPPEVLEKYRFGLVRYITDDPETHIRQEGVYQSPLTLQKSGE
jgi:hypothetical protein